MKETVDDLILTVEDPLSDSVHEFSLNYESNSSLILRLIKKRESLRTLSIKKYNEIKKIREDSDVETLEKKIQDKLKEVSDLKPNQKKKSEKIRLELKELRDSFPLEIERLQKELQEAMDSIDRMSMKICAMILDPVNGIPSEYSGDKVSYIEEIIPDEESVENVISFFLDFYSSASRSHKEQAAKVKIKKIGEK
jgi:hypothetical protein